MRDEDIEYDVDGTTMVGRLCVDDTSGGGTRPTVLLCHEGSGLDDNIRGRARRLAELGYCAFALDYYGGGATLTLEEAMAKLGPIMGDSARTRRLGRAGLDVLLAQPEADADRLAAIGFCFGGSMSLELARDGVPLKAIVGFHPGIGASQHPADSRNITGSVLMCVGSEDPFVPLDARLAFEAEMTEAGVADWTVELYGGVGHTFTNPSVDELQMPGLAYDRASDERSWASMLRLFAETIDRSAS